MMLYKNFEDKLDTFFEYVMAQIKHNGCKPLYKGSDIFEEDVDEDKWYIYDNKTKPILLSEISLNDFCNLKDIVISFGEQQDSTGMPYFNDYVELADLEPVFIEKLKEYYKNDTIEMYKHNISWLLDEYAFRIILPKIYNTLIQE